VFGIACFYQKNRDCAFCLKETKILLSSRRYTSQMNYLLIVMTGIVAFTWGMLFAFYLIFVRTSVRLTRLLSRLTGATISIDEVYTTIQLMIDDAYDNLKKEKNENTDETT
jgi:hypothetical protein